MNRKDLSKMKNFKKKQLKERQEKQKIPLSVKDTKRQRKWNRLYPSSSLNPLSPRSPKKRKLFVLAILFLFSFWFFLGFFNFLSPETRLRKAISEKRYEEALQEVEKLLEKNSKNLVALRLRGKLYYLLSREEDLLEPKSSATVQKAIFSLKKFLEESEKEWIKKTSADSKLITQNKPYPSKKPTNSSKEKLERLNKTKGMLGNKILFYLGYCYFLLGKDHYNKALFYLEQLDLEKFDLEKLVSENLKLGQLTEIQELKNKPKNPKKKKEKKEKKEKQSQYRKEKNLVFQVYGKKYQVSLEEWLGYIAYHAQEYEKSIFFLKKALIPKEKVTEKKASDEKATRKKAILHFYLALSYIQQKQMTLAKKEFFFILSEFREFHEFKDTEKNYSPWLKKVYLSLSEIYFQDKNFKESLKWIKKIRNLHESAQDLYQLGLIYEALKENQNALKSWKKALELDPYQDRIRQKYIRYQPK